MGENTRLCVVDASFLLSYLLPDEENPFVEETMDRFKQGKIKLLSTYLLPFEIFNTLKTVVIRKRITSKLAYELGIVFLEYAILHEKVDYLEALLLAQKEKLSFYDASYVWLARELQVPLLALDKRMEKIARV